MLPPACNLYSLCVEVYLPHKEKSTFAPVILRTLHAGALPRQACLFRSPSVLCPPPPLTEKAAADQGEPEPSLPTSAAAPFLPSVEGSAIYPHASLPSPTPLLFFGSHRRSLLPLSASAFYIPYPSTRGGGGGGPSSLVYICAVCGRPVERGEGREGNATDFLHFHSRFWNLCAGSKAKKGRGLILKFHRSDGQGGIWAKEAEGDGGTARNNTQQVSQVSLGERTKVKEKWSCSLAC